MRLATPYLKKINSNMDVLKLPGARGLQYVAVAINSNMDVLKQLLEGIELDYNTINSNMDVLKLINHDLRVKV